MTVDPESFVTVAQFTNLIEFDMARGLLESEGIECFSPEERFTGISGGFYTYAVTIRLQVRSRDEERARALLEQVESTVIPSDEPTEEQ